jgi:hypothetical protein
VTVVVDCVLCIPLACAANCGLEVRSVGVVLVRRLKNPFGFHLVWVSGVRSSIYTFRCSFLGKRESGDPVIHLLKI